MIGGRLVNRLAEDGWQARDLVRDRGRAGELAELEVDQGPVPHPGVELQLVCRYYWTGTTT